MDMDLIYQNFDSLEISFKGCVSKHILNKLKEAQTEARQIKGKVIAYMGNNRMISVYETGARGGYTYQFNTGLDGEIWLVRESENKEDWCIRVRVSSMGLNLKGYEQVKEDILNILYNDLHAKGSLDDNRLLERISRFDYCFDFYTIDEFNPSYKNFVCTGRTKKTMIGEYEQTASGQNVNYIRIGTMPNRQVVLYNKTSEIIASHKKYWWDIWDLNPNVFKGVIWRVEARAGKKELNQWNLKTFDDFEKMAGDVIISNLKNSRYTIPDLNNKNRNRWKTTDFWQKTINAVNINLNKYISNAKREKIITDHKNEIIKRYETLFKGVIIGYAALRGEDISTIPTVLDMVADQICEDINSNPRKYIQKYNKKAELFSQLDINKGEK